MARRGALQALAERSGSDSDECMFDQTNLLQRRRMDITRMRRSSATMSGHRLTVARTVNLCLSFFALGLCFVMPTATITGLQYRTGSSENGIGNIYRARYGGYIVGCFAGGFLFNCYNRQFLLFLALLATAIGVLVMPFCRILATLMTCTCITGVTMGLLDTGGNVWLLDLWGQKSAPFMQTMHFCFGLGALVAPLVAQPFVGAYNQIGPGKNPFNESHNLLPPLSLRLPNNPYSQRVRRDLSHNDSISASLLPAVNATKILPFTSSSVSITTAAPFSKMSNVKTAEPKKPLFADGEKKFGKWDRTPAHILTTEAPRVNLTRNKATASTPLKNIQNSLNNKSPPPDLSAITKPPTEAAKESKDTIIQTTTPRTVTQAVQSTTSMPPATVCLSCGNDHPSNTNLSSGVNHILPNINNKFHHLAPSTTSLTLPATTPITLHDGPTLKSHRKVLAGETSTSGDTLKAFDETRATTSSPKESTTKATASTVPTEETMKVTTMVPVESSTATTKRHHSTKKVLPDDAEQISWLEAARKKIQESGRFEIAYGILAAYVLVVSVVFLAFLCMNPREGRSKQHEHEEFDNSHFTQSTSRMRLPLIVLMCSFFFFYMGIEVAVGETLKSLFKHGALVTRLVTGEQLIFIFWGSFALARGVSIFISMKVSYRAMLTGDLVLCLIAALILVLGAQQPCLLIAGVVVLATGMASIIPTLFIWLERCTQVTNRLSALLILSAAAGEMTIPELVSAFVRNSTPMALMYVILGVILLCTINLVALCYVTSVRGEKYLAKPDRSLYQLASLDDDIEHWNQGNTKNGQPADGPAVKRNKNNSFFYNRLNSLDS